MDNLPGKHLLNLQKSLDPISSKNSGTQNGGTKTYVSCMDTAYIRENPNPP